MAVFFTARCSSLLAEDALKFAKNNDDPDSHAFFLGGLLYSFTSSRPGAASSNLDRGTGKIVENVRRCHKLMRDVS